MTESNAERLKRIEGLWNSDIQEEWDCVSGQDISWLIDQAQSSVTADQLYGQLQQERSMLQTFGGIIKELAGVLKFYGDEASYIPHENEEGELYDAIARDDGQRARKALVGLEFKIGSEV